MNYYIYSFARRQQVGIYLFSLDKEYSKFLWDSVDVSLQTKSTERLDLQFALMAGGPL